MLSAHFIRLRAPGWHPLGRVPASARAPKSLSPPRPTHLAGSRGNLKKARSDCVLFRVQLGAAQKFGMVVRPPAGPALPSPPRQGSSAAPRGRGGELGRPAGSARPRAEEGLAREAARGRRGARAEAGLGPRLHSAVCGREDLPPPPPLLHLQPARDAAASFPQCTRALEGALSSLSPPPPPSLQATFPAGGHAHSSAFGRLRSLNAHAHNPIPSRKELRMRRSLPGLANASSGYFGRFVVCGSLQVQGKLERYFMAVSSLPV